MNKKVMAISFLILSQCGFFKASENSSAKPTIFLFMGAPGSGKGALSSKLSQDYGWNHLSTGNLFRDHMAKHTEIGESIRESMDKGMLVSDQIVSSIVNQWLLPFKDKMAHLIFDGYPRTLIQAEMLYDFLEDELKDYNLVLELFDIDTNILLERILSRVSCSNKDCQRIYSLIEGSSAFPKEHMICDVCYSKLEHRSDDNAKSLKTRIDIYKKNEQDILNFFKTKGVKIVVLDCTKTMDNVFEQFNDLNKENIFRYTRILGPEL